MSVSTLLSPNNYTIYCDKLITEVVEALEFTTDDISTVGIVIRAPPDIDNANNNVLVRNATTGAVELNTDIGLSNVSDGANLGVGAPVFHTKNGTILEFNSLAGNGAQGVTITPAPGPGGDITINNTFLDQDVKTTASPSFLSAVTVTSTTTATMTLTASSVPIGTRLEYSSGVNTHFLEYPPLTANRTATFPDASGTIALTSSPSILDGNVLIGTISTPKLYTYIASCNTTANASFNVFQFAPPNMVDSQSIICNLEACFYNKVTTESAYVKKVYTFTYIPGVSFNIAFTDVSIVDRPALTNYFTQATGNIGPDEIRIFVQPNNADSTDVLLNFSFLCKS